MKDIFSLYSERYQGKQIIKDGIISPQKWEESDCKLLFLAKEDHKIREGFDFDIRKAHKYWAENGPGGNKRLQKLYTIALAIHHPDVPFPYNENFDEGEWIIARNSYICSAFVNIKKVLGNPTSRKKDIDNFALSNADLLRYQIEEIDPNIVVCCGTFPHVHHLYQVEKHKSIADTYTYNNRYFIDLNHFAYWIEPVDDPYNHVNWIRKEMLNLCID